MQNPRVQRGGGEAFCWGLFLSVFGVLIVAILHDQFEDEYPLAKALVGMAIGVVLIGLAYGCATIPIRY